MQDETAERGEAPVFAAPGKSNGHGGAEGPLPPEVGRKELIPGVIPEAITSPTPGASVTYIESLLLADTIVNNYHCSRKQECDILESAPEAGQEGEPMESVIAPGVELITCSHAEILSDEYWRPRGLKGRTRQAILQQRRRIAHVRSISPPNGRPTTLLVKASFLEWDQANPPREWPEAGASRAA